jgi:DNA-binding response OmpR family regulator
MENKTVLIIEDDDDIVALLTIHLSDLGCKTVSESNGQRGLARAREERFDLVILDIMLPGLNGMEICRKISRPTGIRLS